MRFPLSLTGSLTKYLFRMKRTRQERFPLVLMLEPLYACNLHCSGCGRIREYADSLQLRLTPQECFDAVQECPAPVVSVCGGEPLIHKEIVEIIEGLVDRGRHIYLCTNGILLQEKLAEFDAIKNPKLKTQLYWNVHLDGPQSLHDAIVEKPGVFEKAIAGIEAAKKAGYKVYTNTTLYKQTSPELSVQQLKELAKILAQRNIDGMMVAPGFGYESVENSCENKEKEDSFFLTSNEIHTLFREIRKEFQKKESRHFRITTTPIYMDFLCGERELSCAAFANPTRNVLGWKGPCYLVTDQHYSSYADLMSQTDWDKIGPQKDSRCENCCAHCGFEPAAVLACRSLADMLRLGTWQLGF